MGDLQISKIHDWFTEVHYYHLNKMILKSKMTSIIVYSWIYSTAYKYNKTKQGNKCVNTSLLSKNIKIYIE